MLPSRQKQQCSRIPTDPTAPQTEAEAESSPDLAQEDAEFLAGFDATFRAALCSGRLCLPLDPCIARHLVEDNADRGFAAEVLAEFDWSGFRNSEALFGTKVLNAFRQWTSKGSKLTVFWDIDGTLGEYSSWGESRPWCTRPIAQPLLAHLHARYPRVQQGLLSNRPQSSIENCFFSETGVMRHLACHFEQEWCHTSSCLLSASSEGPTNGEIVAAKGSLLRMMRDRFPDRCFWLIDDLSIDPALGLSVESCRPPDILAAAARLLCRFEE